MPANADGGDSPAWSLQRGPYVPQDIVRDPDALPYAELHAHSSFSFLDGASSPEELLEEAERLGLHALAITDHDGFYGIVRFAEAAETAEREDGVRRRALAGAHRAAERRGRPGGQPSAGARPPGGGLSPARRRHHRGAAARCREGPPGLRPRRAGRARRRALGGADRMPQGRGAAGAGTTAIPASELDRLVPLFGRDNVYVELIDHGNPLDTDHNDALAALAAERGLPVIATGNVHYASPAQRHLATAVAAVRASRSLDELDGWLPPAGTAHLRSGREMRARFARYPGAVERTVTLADELAFPLRRAKPALPKQQVPEGHTPMSWLRQLVWDAVPVKYPDLTDADRERIEAELAVIETKDFPGYFLIVHDIVRLRAAARASSARAAARPPTRRSATCSTSPPSTRSSTSCRSSGSCRRCATRSPTSTSTSTPTAARRSSSGCSRSTGAATPRRWRTSSSTGRRTRCATWRRRSGTPPVSRTPGRSRWSAGAPSCRPGDDNDIPAGVIELAMQLLKAPRHLGIHSGGMVLTDRPVGEVVPIEHARMENRTVIQWDKDDAAWMGLVKFDLLGLGMLAALQYCFDMIRASTGEEWELRPLPKEEPAVYDMLCRADSIGVFQVESRAQMGLLPRLQPRRFYDLVVQIALVRPGPIQGGAVHPFVRRKLGQEQITYLHPKLVPPLERTLGIPVFQEQLMQMAMAVGECTGEDADLLRRAMGSKRGLERIESLREKLYAGMASNGLTGEVADDIYAQDPGVRELRLRREPLAELRAARLRELVDQAALPGGVPRRAAAGAADGVLLPGDARPPMPGGTGSRCGGPTSCALPLTRPSRGSPRRPLRGAHRPRLLRRPPPALHRAVRPHGPGCDGRPPQRRRLRRAARPRRRDAHRHQGRRAHRRRAGCQGRLPLDGGPGAPRGPHPRTARVARDRRRLRRVRPDSAGRRSGAPDRPPKTARSSSPARSSRCSRRCSPTRPRSRRSPPTSGRPASPPTTTRSPTSGATLDERGVLSSAAMRTAETGRRIEVAGLVTHRQRPATASGITFLNLEDEHGLVNVICSMGVWGRYRRVVRESPALIVRGMLERSTEGVTNLLADRFEPLTVGVTHRSRDFQ